MSESTDGPGFDGHVPLSPCPACGTLLDGADCPREEPSPQPTPGDLTICAYCQSVNQFTETLTLRRLPPEDFSQLDIEDRKAIWQLQDVLRHFQATRSTP